jgi:hypothetical protein
MSGYLMCPMSEQLNEECIELHIRLWPRWNSFAAGWHEQVREPISEGV